MTINVYKTVLLLFVCPLALEARVFDLHPGRASIEIQKIFDQMRAYDTIEFKPGVYLIEGITISKPCTVLGDSLCILDGSGKFELFVIRCEYVTIRGFTFQHSGYSSLNDFAAIKIINASSIKIEHNSIINTYFGIHISNSSYCTIRNNTIRGKSISELLNGNAIHLWKCNHMTIEYNDVTH